MFNWRIAVLWFDAKGKLRRDVLVELFGVEDVLPVNVQSRGLTLPPGIVRLLAPRSFDQIVESECKFLVCSRMTADALSGNRAAVRTLKQRLVYREKQLAHLRAVKELPSQRDTATGMWETYRDVHVDRLVVESVLILEQSRIA
jgi:hypothetical protein